MEYCENCQKQIQETKFSLHIGYCMRNIIKCSICNIPYDKNEFQEHEEQYHQLKQKCKFCNGSYNKSQIKNHQGNCDKAKKQRSCQYCELSVPQANFLQHISYCEARTSNCEICGRAIMNKDYFNHLVQCQQQQHLINSKTNSKQMEMQLPVAQKYQNYDRKVIQPQKVQESAYKRYPTQVTRIVYQPGTSTPTDATLQGRSYVSSVRREIPIQRTISQSESGQASNQYSLKSVPISQSKSYSYSYVQSKQPGSQSYTYTSNTLTSPANYSSYTYSATTTSSNSEVVRSITTASLSKPSQQAFSGQNYPEKGYSIPSFVHSTNSYTKSQFSNYQNNQEFQNTFGVQSNLMNQANFLDQDAQLQAVLMASLADSIKNS